MTTCSICGIVSMPSGLLGSGRLPGGRTSRLRAADGSDHRGATTAAAAAAAAPPKKCRRSIPRAPIGGNLGLSATGSHGALGVHVGVSLGDGLALVVRLAAAAHAELELGPAALEVQRQRHQREVLLVDPLLDLVDLVLVQEQLAGALELVAALGR